MQIKIHQTNVRTLYPGDKGFTINTAFTSHPRAGFAIKPTCPKEYQKIITECIERKWLLPVAIVPDKELIWQQLGE